MYAISDKEELIEVKTGKFPTIFPWALPFPDADPKDPNFGMKIAYNQDFTRHVIANANFEPKLIWIGDGGYEREILIKFYSFGNFPHADKVPNPENFARQTIFSIREPYDLQGTSIMTWQRNGNALDSNFAFVPAIRRVRRSSPASRSDAMFGSDMTTDDFAVFNGKMESMHWNYIETKEMLLPFLGKDPIPVNQQPDGGYLVQKSGWEGVKFGYEVEGWKGAGWCPVNWIWKKRKVHLIEMIPRDKYYNYGKSIMMVDAETDTFMAKENYDRAGAPWKIIMSGMYLVKSPDGKFQMVDPQGGTVALDLKRNHATAVNGVYPNYTSIYEADTDPNDFTMAGFMKFCK
jgi:hypothetical protein